VASFAEAGFAGTRATCAAVRVRGAVVWLALVVAILAAVASGAGLLWSGTEAPATATSVRGEEVDLQGEGLYAYDTVFLAAGSRGTDLVTLGLGVPFLVLALVLYRRGSLPGTVLLAGGFGYFLYAYASRGLGNAYNGLFPAYIALFSASLFGLVITAASIDRALLEQRYAGNRHRRPLGVFLLASAAVTSLVWLVPLVASVARGDAPKYVDTYTTAVTDVLDLGVLVPSLTVAAIFVLRRRALGYVLAAVLLVLLLFVAATIIAGTVFQVAADVDFTTGEVVGPIAGFLVLAAIGAWLLVGLLREAVEGGETEWRRSSG